MNIKKYLRGEAEIKRRINIKLNKKDKETILRELDISVQDEEKDKQYVERLGKNEDKVKYLRLVKRYTQTKTSKIIGITERQVRRIEKQFKMSE